MNEIGMYQSLVPYVARFVNLLWINPINECFIEPIPKIYPHGNQSTYAKRKFKAFTHRYGQIGSLQLHFAHRDC